MIDDTSMMYVKYNMKIDFITIVFHNKIEYELLKLQALSFAYVDVTLIHRILIVFNDVTQYKGFFNDFFKEIMPYYPDSHKSMIQIMHLNELNLKIKCSDWFTQQAIKIIISKKIKTKYYITLDAKNHFIENIKLFQKIITNYHIDLVEIIDESQITEENEFMSKIQSFFKT